MKVDFITRHAIPNYGSILQTYATQKVLNKLGCDSEVINYIRMDETANKTIVTNCNIKENGIKSKIKRLGYIIIQGPNVKHMHKKFSKFRKTYLKQTEKEYNSVEELKNNLPNADVYCTGSDQVWAKIGGVNYDEAYFLNFVPEGKRCISYAASLGKSKIDEELEKRLPELLKKYETILVRENTAEEIIKEKGFNNVKQVLDPTLLLNKKEWLEIQEEKPIVKGNYILCYFLGKNIEHRKFAEKLKERTGYKIVSINHCDEYVKYSDKFADEIPYNIGPGEFINLIRNAKYVCTDSFHGTVFSLINKVNFFTFERFAGKNIKMSTNSRIYSLLELVALEERLIKESNQLETKINENINYDEVDNVIENFRQTSIEFLKQALLD